MENKKTLKVKIRKIFEAAQEQYGHQKLIEKCKKIHTKCESEEAFVQEFTAALKFTFVYQEKHAVDNIFSFISKYISMLYAVNSDQSTSDSTVDESAPFVNRLLKFLFKSHGASLSDARLRCMQLLSKILSGMPENSLISDEVWSKLKETVLCRLQDKNLGVRAQAVLTAKMLQDPKNANCEIIKALIFHFNDPSPAVRRCVVSSIALNKLTISHVLARTRDVNDNVRRNAYLVFSKIKIINLTIKFRITILDRGLQDRSEIVRKCVQNIVLVNWVENFNKDILKFLEALDVVSSSEIAIKTIEAILRTQLKEDIIKQLPIDEKTHLIPLESMTPETVLLWRCLAHHFWKEQNDEELENMLPNLTTLCEHIRRFFKLEEPGKVNLSEEEQWIIVKEREILTHLLQLIKVFDLSDEMGRSKLKEMIIDMLISPKISNSQMKFLVELLVLVIPSNDNFIQELTEVISEIRQPFRTVTLQISLKDRMNRDLKVADLELALNDLREREYGAVSCKNYAEAQKLKDEIEAVENELKALVDQPVAFTQEVNEEKNDPVTLCKCLTILVEMIRCSKVKDLIPKLRNLKENFLTQCMASRDLLTQSLAIEALAQFCILDKELAKDNLIRFLLMISEEGDNEINIPSLKGVFDIIHMHGVECFEQLSQNDDDDLRNNSKIKNRTLMTANTSFHGDSSPLYDEPSESFTEVKCLKNLNALLYCKSNDELKATAYEGLCKLLLSGVICSPSILSRIIIKGFSPIIDCESEDFIRQTFMVFFPIFASNTPRSQEMIEAAFIPTIKTILNAPLGSPDADINPKDVVAFLIDHTKPDINKHTAKTLHVHNNLALSFCHEIYKDICSSRDSGYETQIYIKALNHLDLSFESKSYFDQIKTLTSKLEKDLRETTYFRSLSNFIKKLHEKNHNVVSSVENTLMTDSDDCRFSKRSSFQEKNNFSFNIQTNSITKENFKMNTTTKLNMVCESPELPKISGADNSFCSPASARSCLVVVPESPDISD